MATKKKVTYKLAPGPDVDPDREVLRDSRGRRITNEYVREAVENARRQLSRGRPSLSGQASRSPQVTFRLPPELRAKAEALAARQGKRVSEVARDALEAYLARRKVS